MALATLYISIMQVFGMNELTSALAVLSLLGSFACTATEGPLLVHTTKPGTGNNAASDAGSDASSARAATRAVVRPGMTLQYQITGDVDTSVDAQLFVIDLFDTTQQQVAELHAKGAVVIAYVSAGSFEPWREDSAAFPKSAIGMSLADFPDESWLDIRNKAVRSAIETRFDRAHDKGFDGVFLSTLGGYMQMSGFALTRADELDYDRFLASAAQARGLSAGLSGDFELGTEIAAAFNWALDIGCIARAHCDELGSFLARGKAVFDLETEGQHDAVCMQAARYGIATTLKRPAYDAWRVPCM
jgi:hypothetical protein